MLLCCVIDHMDLQNADFKYGGEGDWGTGKLSSPTIDDIDNDDYDDDDSDLDDHDDDRHDDDDDDDN